MRAAPRMLLTAGALILASACLDKVNQPSDTGELRLVQITPGLDPVTVEVDGEPVLEGIPYGQSSRRALVPSGERTIVIREGSTVIATVTHSIQSGSLNSVVLADSQAQFSTEVETDTGAVSPQHANIRMVVVATEDLTPPTDLHALMTWSGGPVDSVVKFGVDATVARYGSLMYFEPGSFTFKYVEKDTESPILAEVTFDVALGETKAVVLSRKEDGSYSLEVVTESEEEVLQ